MAYIAGSAGATAAVAAATMIAQAIKASGAIVRVEPNDFVSILSKIDNPLLVLAVGGFPKKKYQYLTGYKGLVFFTKSADPLQLASGTELITAKKIWTPS